jgi:hypothetical protein
MPEMKLTSDIRRGHDNDEGLLAEVYIRSKIALL